MQPGYYLIILPDQSRWESHPIIPLPDTEPFLRQLRATLPEIPYSPINFARFEGDIEFSEEDQGCLAVLATLLVSAALRENRMEMLRPADSMMRIIRQPYFWIQGRRRGCCTIETSAGFMPAQSMEEAQRMARFYGDWTLSGSQLADQEL